MTAPEPAPQELRVAVCIPSGESWKAMTAFQMMCLAVQSTAAGLTLIPINHRGGDAAENRNAMVALGRKEGAHAFLFVDADMIVPPDGLVRLLRRRVPIVGADYRNRVSPFGKLGTSAEGPAYGAGHVDPPGGMVKRGMLGLGFVLVRAAVFEKLPAPWFARTWIAEQATADNPNGFSTDDTYFFHYCRHHGFDVWCDLDVTRDVAHIGEILIPWERDSLPRGAGA